MKIKSITHSGINALYTTCQTQGISNHLNDLLNQVNIYMHIEDMTSLESFFMKEFVNGSITYVNETLLDKPEELERIFPAESFPDVQPAITSILNILPDLDADNDVKIKPSYSLLPIGCISRSALVSLTGHTLMIFFGEGFVKFWNTLFVTDSGHILTEEERPEKLDFTNDSLREKFENLCIQLFLTKFYRFMEEKLTCGDKYVDAHIYNNYYRFLNDKNLDCALSAVRTPVGIASFLGNDNIQNDLVDIRGKLKNSELLSANKNYTKIDFVCKCSICVFIQLMMVLPLECLTNYSDININLVADSIAVSRDLSKYKTRVINKMKVLNAVKVEVSKLKSIPIGKYNFILMNSPIMFQLSLGPNDIQNIKSFYDQVKETKMYGESNNYIANQIDFILMNIVEYSKSIKSIIPDIY